MVEDVQILNFIMPLDLFLADSVKQKTKGKKCNFSCFPT